LGGFFFWDFSFCFGIGDGLLVRRRPPRRAFVAAASHRTNRVRLAGVTGAVSILVVHNWFEELKARVPTK
jgi:hypothetical protein